MPAVAKGDGVNEMRDAALDLLVELARPASHDTVLDYAAGVGFGGFAVAPDVLSVEVADEQPDMLHEGRRLARELGLVNVAFTLADLYVLPFKNGSFTLVVCQGAVHLLPEPAASLAEMARVISDGGRIVLVDTVVDEVTDKALNDLARLRQPAHRRHYPRSELAELAAKAGLRVCVQREVRRTVDLDYWLQAAAVLPSKVALIRDRFMELPVDVQTQLDVAFADGLVSFSHDMLGLRLERS
jgi:ubiquinone/menaquinone biosynthesis C-methylase UbiE